MFSELFSRRYDVSYPTGGFRTISRLDKGGLMARKQEEYDWLNDPFDEKKSAEELERARGSKGAGCALVVVVAACIILIIGFVGVLGLFGASSVA